MTDRPPFAPKARPAVQRAHKLAKVWERKLADWHATYRIRGFAHIERHHEGVKTVDGRTIRVEDGSPDFGGTIRGGRSLVFDAKFVSTSNHYYLSSMKEHQRSSLFDHAKLGGLAFVVVRFDAFDVQAAFPVVEGGEKVLKAEFAVESGLTFGDEGWWSVVGRTVR